MIKVQTLHHVGLTVPDMAQAVSFFETVFGAVTVLKTGRLEAEDDFVVRRLGVSSGAVLLSQTVLACGEGSLIELFEYQKPAKGEAMRDNSSVGAFHLGFQVNDVEVAAARLRSAGIDVLDGPTLIESGPMAGLTWIYLRAPWGLALELLSMAPTADGGHRAIWKEPD